MEVLKTISPNVSPSAAQERPRKLTPSSKTSSAGCCSRIARLLTALNKLLRFIQPALVGAILVSRRRLYCFNACLHRTRRFALMTKAGVRAAHQVQPFRIRRPLLKKLFKRIPRVFVLTGGNVGGAYFAPNFVLAMRLIAGHHLFKISNCVGITLLGARDSSQLVMRVNFFFINLNCALEPLARRFQFTALLMNQTEVVMGRSIRWV